MKGAGKPLSLLKVKFIQAWQNVLARSILKPIGQQPQYRGPTPQRHKSGGQWRNIVGGAKWMGKKAACEHKKWLAAQKRVARANADVSRVYHDFGAIPAKHLSRRAFNRSSLRAIGKAVG